MDLMCHMAKWKKTVAVLLTIALTGNLGVIVPLADSKDNARQTVTEVTELPENVRKQTVEFGTEETELNLPKSLEAKIEQTEKKEEKPHSVKASDSDAEWEDPDEEIIDDTEIVTKELWKKISVTWSLANADNGLDIYDGNTSGVYTFKAELDDPQYEAEDSLLPVIQVEVGKEAPEEKTDDEEIFIEEIVDLGEIETSSLIANYRVKDGTVDLTEGNHEKWIDRISVPDYAKECYELLEEGSDNDGNNDWLIEDEYFSKGNAVTSGQNMVFNGVLLMTVSDDSNWMGTEWPDIQKCIQAACSAFDRDHPEVFWLSGTSQLFCTGKGNGSGWEYNVYYISKIHESKDGDYDVRYETYQKTGAIKKDINTRDLAIDKIMTDVPGDDIVDRIIGYNDWLTQHNQYCLTFPKKGELAGESITALIGSIGGSGPVCEGYARAFKVLCDETGIPCVLVDGYAYGDTKNGHMWNYVEVEGNWYAMDVTWNDPVTSDNIATAVSGYEGNDWTLLGSATSLPDSNGNNRPFIESHPVNNNPGSLCFPNGPELSTERYPIIRPIVEFSITEQKEIYTGKAPEIINAPTVKLEDGSIVQNPQISYSYAASENGKYTNGLPVDAGTYFIRATVASSKEDGYKMAVSSNTLKMTIDKTSRSISAPTVKEKTDVSVTLNPITSFAGSNDGTVEYAWNTANDAPNNGWQKDPLITGLNRNTTYYFFARITNGKNYQNAVSASGTEQKTDKTRLPKPTLKHLMYSYTGGNITVELNGFDENIMGITGQSATECGDYQAEITLKSEDFTWEDGTSAPVVLDWKILLGRTLASLTADNDKITENHIVLNATNAVPAESISDGALEYGYAMEADSSQVKNWQSGTEFAGLESGTTYYFFARITGGTEHIDVTSAALPLTTKKIKLAKPVLSDDGNYIYNGSLIQASISGFRTEEMAVSSNAFRNAGNYTAKISLKDTKHYEWEDGTSEPVSFGWKIAKKPVTVKAADKSKYYGQANPELTLEELGEGLLAGDDKISDLKITLTTTAEKNSAAGSYPITGKAADDSNYEVTVKPGTLTVTRTSSGGSSGGGGGGGGSSSRPVGNMPGGSGSSLPSYVVKGEWSMANGTWHFSDASGNAAVNNWVAAYNPYAASGQQNYDWFRFDQDGNMMTGWFTDADGSRYYLNPASDGTLGRMLTGWVWIADETGVQRCYYFNPNSDGYRGKMLANTVIDGYTIDSNGWWIVDGTVQMK